MGKSRENAPKTPTKTKLTTKRGKQRQRHAFAREAAVILQFVQVVKTGRKQERKNCATMLEQLLPSGPVLPRPEGATAPRMQSQGSSLCTCRGYCTRLVRQKASAKENTSSWTLLQRGGSKGHAQVLS